MQKIIPLNEITAIRKAKTAAIFPNAIEIAAGGKKVNFFLISFFEISPFRLLNLLLTKLNCGNKMTAFLWIILVKR